MCRLPRDLALVSTGGRVDLRREDAAANVSGGAVRMAGPMLSADKRRMVPVEARRMVTCFFGAAAGWGVGCSRTGPEATTGATLAGG